STAMPVPPPVRTTFACTRSRWAATIASTNASAAARATSSGSANCRTSGTWTGSDILHLRKGRQGGFVDDVGIESAQLFGEAFGRGASCQADQRVRFPGTGQRRHTVVLGTFECDRLARRAQLDAQLTRR